MPWLVFRDGAIKSGEVWSGGSPPEQGVNIPNGSRVVEFKPLENRNPWHYKLDKDELVYDPPELELALEPSLEELKRAAYENELGGLPNQLDAAYKGLLILIPAFAKAGLLTPEEVEILTPNKDARPDTPAGWLGKVKDIKERFPK